MTTGTSIEALSRSARAAAEGPAAGHRNAGFDALRATLALLVVLHHCAITYGAIGGWYYREVPTDRSVASTLLVFFCTVNQAFFMGLFFLLAGYLTPGAVARNGLRRYAVDRLARLGLPLLAFVGVIGPATIALARTARGDAFFATLATLWRRRVVEIGPLWFCEALLIFAAAWLLVSTFGRRRAALRQAALRDPAPWPGNARLLAAALATGLIALALRASWPVGVNVWGLQLGHFGSYIVLFAFGCLAARHGWLEAVPVHTVRTWWRVAKVALPVLPAVHFLGRVLPSLKGAPLDVVYAFWEPFVAWGVILKLLFEYQRRFASLNGFWKSFARRAYTIFVIHPPVLAAVALAWRTVPANALLKFAVTGMLSCGLCFVIAGALLRIPLLRRVL